MPLTLSGTNGVSGVDGSASTPANRGSDTNTGIVYGTDTVQIATGGTTAVTVDSSQNVGIGTSSPGTLLDVSSTGVVTTTIRSTSTGGSREAKLRLNVASTGGDDPAGQIEFTYGTGYTVAGSIQMSHDNNNMKFFTGTTERARIDSSGNLLVGDTSANGARFMSKVASANYAGRFYVAAASTQSTPGILIDKYDNTSTTSQVFVQFSINQQATLCGQINADGANTAAFGTTSDIRLKENISPLTPQLANICSLKPCEFDFKDGSGHQIGFIAQEMQEIYPDVVGENTNKMLMITGWSKTEARLVKAIQELSAKLDAAEARIAALEAK